MRELRLQLGLTVLKALLCPSGPGSFSQEKNVRVELLYYKKPVTKTKG